MPTACACKSKAPTFEPIDDRVVIVPDARETESPGGIVLPEQAAIRPQLGKVLAVGPNVAQVTTGARVLFSSYAETVTLNEIEYVLVKEGDLFAILHEKAARH